MDPKIEECSNLESLVCIYSQIAGLVFCIIGILIENRKAKRKNGGKRFFVE
jgi:hypothetical protein